MKRVGGDRLLYCDTDSIHVAGNDLDIDISNDLGKLKLEFEGEGCYLGRKLYGLRSWEPIEGTDYEKKTEKIRTKGVKVGGRMGARIDFDFLLRTIRDGPQCIEFQSFPTALEVFTGKKTACSLTRRKRTIRVTKGIQYARRNKRIDQSTRN
jgi:hypothetical protein